MLWKIVLFIIKLLMFLLNIIFIYDYTSIKNKRKNYKL